MRTNHSGPGEGLFDTLAEISIDRGHHRFGVFDDGYLDSPAREGFAHLHADVAAAHDDRALREPVVQELLYRKTVRQRAQKEDSGIIQAGHAGPLREGAGTYHKFVIFEAGLCV